MDKLFLHTSTRLFLQSFFNNPPQALLLEGREGVGLLTIAQTMAKGEVRLVVSDPSGKSTGISIERIRELYIQTRTKSPSLQTIIIDNADKMSLGAQAAFLKLLEEPNNSTYFILTTHALSRLLPTIRSRTQYCHVQPIPPAQSIDFIMRLGVEDKAKLSQLQFLASGLPAELTRLIKDSVYFQKRAAFINDARAFVTSSSYQKLKIIHQYKNDRESVLQLLNSIIAILHYTLETKPQEKLIRELLMMLELREKIASNQNITLQFAQAVL